VLRSSRCRNFLVGVKEAVSAEDFPGFFHTPGFVRIPGGYIVASEINRQRENSACAKR